MSRYEKLSYIVDEFVIIPTVIAFVFTVAAGIICIIDVAVWWVINAAIATSIVTALWWLVWLGFFIADKVAERRVYITYLGLVDGDADFDWDDDDDDDYYDDDDEEEEDYDG